MDEEKREGLREKAFKFPDAWPFLFAAFVVTASFLVLNYRTSQKNNELIQETIEMAKKAQEVPELDLIYDRVDWDVDAGPPSMQTEFVLGDVFNSSLYIYNKTKLSRIKLVNTSKVLAKRIKLIIKIKDESPFVIGFVTLKKPYGRHWDWNIVSKDKQFYKFVVIDIEVLKQPNRTCEILFLYAYSKLFTYDKKQEKGALSYAVSWEGLKTEPKTKEVDLEF